jgi:hypothetical protein
LALGAGSLQAAWAGSPDDPEIVDPCPEVEPDQLMQYGDVCGAWFESVWDPVYQEGQVVDWEFRALRTTLELAGDLDDRPTSTWAYQLSWGVGDCRHFWYIRDTLDQGAIPAIGKSCPGEPSHYGELSGANVVTSGRRIIVTIPATKAIEFFGVSYEQGIELKLPAAYVQATVEPRGIVQVAQDWEEAGPGRSFTIGQDKPPIS